MEKELFVRCICGSLDHQLVMSWDPSEDEPQWQMLYIEIYLVSYQSFFQRLWRAVRYVFGYKCRYGNWDEMLVSPAKAVEMRQLLDKFIAASAADGGRIR